MLAGEMLRSTEGRGSMRWLQRMGKLDGLGRRTVFVFVVNVIRQLY